MSADYCYDSLYISHFLASRPLDDYVSHEDGLGIIVYNIHIGS